MAMIDAERAAVERYVAEAANKALAIGGLCASALGLVGAAGIFGFVLVTGRREFLGPCLFAFFGGLLSLAVWASARARLLYGPLRYAVMLPFTSMPTFAFLACEFMYPAGAATFLTGPFSYLYLFLLAITGFLFSPRLTMICTLSSGVQYFALQMWARPVYLQVKTPDPLIYLDLTEPFIYANKILMLAGTGAATAGIAWVGRNLLHRVLHEEREKELIGRLFGEYVSPEVKQHVVEQKGHVVGERREVAILFSDLRGFSSFSEGRDPAEVMARLNVYFERMVSAIESEGGVVDKFVGDAVMAVFGGLLEVANPCDAASRAARSMRSALASLNAEWAANGEPPFDNGIGLHYGAVIQGPLGASTRKEFTIIGDAVNIASRLESCTKDLSASIVISRELYDRLSETEQTTFTRSGEIAVKGKREVLTVYQSGKIARD